MGSNSNSRSILLLQSIFGVLATAARPSVSIVSAVAAYRKITLRKKC